VDVGGIDLRLDVGEMICLREERRDGGLVLGVVAEDDGCVGVAMVVLVAAIVVDVVVVLAVWR
jgi:hypothetical protein